MNKKQDENKTADLDGNKLEMSKLKKTAQDDAVKVLESTLEEVRTAMQDCILTGKDFEIDSNDMVRGSHLHSPNTCRHAVRWM